MIGPANNRFTYFYVGSIACALAITQQSTAQSNLQLRVEIPAVLINDAEEAKTALHPLRPYLEASVFAILDISLAEVDTRAVSDWIKLLELPIASDDSLADLFRFAEAAVATLRKSGVNHVYVIASTRIAADRSPVLVLPCNDPTAVNEFAKTMITKLPPTLKLSTHPGDDVVLVGPQDAITRLTERNPSVRDSDTRDALLTRLVDSSALAHRLVVMLPEEARGDLAALWPDRMPQGSPVEFSPRQVAADLRSLTVSWASPPEMTMRVAIDTVDGAASRRLQTVARDVLALQHDVTKDVILMPSDTGFVIDASEDVIMKVVRSLR